MSMKSRNKFFVLILLSYLLCLTVSTDQVRNQTNPNPEPPKRQCSNDNDCNHGICDANYMCNCKPFYIDYTDKNGIFHRCFYEQKSQTKAFLYELFINFGAGHFYLGRTNFGFFKMISFLFGLFLICLFPLTAKFLNDKFESDFSVVLFSCVYYYYAIGLAVWYIYDLVQFGMNSYPDANGMLPRKWGSQ